MTRQSASTVIDRKTDGESFSLSRWKERLTGKPETSVSSRSEKLARLDGLFREIASSSSSGDPKIAKRISELGKEFEERQKKQQQVQEKQANSPSRAEALQYSSLLSRLSKGIASIQAEIKSAEIESGRQIVAAGKEGFGEAAQAEEAREIIAELKAAGPGTK